MSMLVQVCDELLWIYRERFGRPEFWAEPLNAMTNASFLFAAAAAMHLARQRAAVTRATVGLVSLAGVIGLGSFYFHTVPNRLTMWLDIAPIALFQIAFLWHLLNGVVVYLVLRAWIVFVALVEPQRPSGGTDV